MSTQHLKWLLLISWWIVLSFSLWFNFVSIDTAAEQMALTEGRTSWLKDSAIRQWATDKGGVYAPPTDKYPPNPYLAHIPDRDIVTTEGKGLSLINPAYMFRQIYEMANDPNITQAHITSDKPLRPENKADDWEIKVLQRFEKEGVKEYYSLETMNNKPYFRYMQAMFVKKGCLKCHAVQGYHEGDLRGGVSFSIPYAPYLQVASAQKNALLLWHLLIGILGVAGIWLGFRKIVHNEQAIKTALDKETQVNAEKQLLLINLEELNHTLENRVAEETQKSRQQDLLLIQQSRLASMGEMIHNIAHQWRQPLNALAIILANIKDDYKYGELTEEQLNKSTEKSQRILEQMSKTIDDFRNFFKADKEAKTFDVCNVINDSLVIVEASLNNNQIELIKECQTPLPCYGYPNQLSQAILNILTNAKDALKATQQTNAQISIHTYVQNEHILVEISDNAGGIAPDIIGKIFDPYFTTKESGSGIGLYMARMIVEKNHHGRIEASNAGDGAKFIIQLPLSSDN